MNINNIKNTKFLKKMKIKELEDLSNDIREFIIDNVSNTGGHLSSNLGIVDLMYHTNAILIKFLQVEHPYLTH